MPSISRARIVNFYYNDGVRFIPDIIFGFEDSRGNTLDTLLEFENGGGKTVLVQLLMQPVVPMARIQSRRIGEYFRKSSDHSFILLEWKLDRSTDRLLTGIAMTGSQNAGENEDNRQVKFFTFINHYNAMGDKFDIVNFPLSETSGGRFTPAAFEKVRSLARGLEYYHSDDVKKYRRRLDDFGINAGEWENILVKINEREGGIDDFTEVYSTADKLLDKFIIPGIQNADSKGRGGQSAVEAMFLNFAESCGQADGKMRLREKISGFTKKLEEFTPRVTELWELSEENRGAVRQLFDYIYSLKYAISEARKNADRLLSEKAAAEEKAAHIVLEKYSREYYCDSDSLKEKTQSYREAEERFGEADARKKEAEHFRRVLLAADKYKSLGEAEREKIKYETALKRLTDESFDSRIGALRFSLHNAARELFDETEISLAELSEMISENNLSIEAKTYEESEISRKRDELRSETDRLRGQNTQLCTDINRGLERLQISVSEMLDGSFDPEDIKSARQELQGKISSCNERLEKLSGEALELENRSSDNFAKINRLEAERHDIKNKTEKAAGELEEYESRYNAVCGIVSALSMSRETVFSHEPGNVLEGQLHELGDKIKASERRIEALSEQLKNARKGNIHMPESAIAFLDCAGIDYQTGTAYLSAQEGIREKILDAEPLTAFSVIVSGDRERRAILENAAGDCEVTAAVPVFTYSELAEISEGKRVSDVSQGRFLTAYSRDYFEDREKYIKSAADRLDNEKCSCAALENSLKDKERQLSLLRAFDYPSDYKSSMENLLHSLSENYAENEKNTAESEEDNRQISARKAAIKKDEGDILKELGSLERKSDCFEEICIKMNEFYGISQEISEKESSLRLLEKQLHTINESLEGAKKLSLEYEDRQRNFAAQRSEYMSVMSETGGEGGRYDELIPEKYDVLKARYEAAKQEFSADKRELDGNLSRCGKRIAELREELGRMPVTEAEYSTTVYSPGKMEQAEEKIKAADEEWKGAFEQKSLLDMECRQLREKITETQRLIGDMGREALPRSEVGGDFEARLEECRRLQRAAEEKLSEVLTDMKNYEYELKVSEKISEGYPDSGEACRSIPIAYGSTEDIRRRIDGSEKALRAKEREALDLIEENLSGYAAENVMFGNVTEHLKGFIKNRTSGDKYFTLREKLEQDTETLNKQRARLDAELSDIESSRNELVINCIQRSVSLYDGLKMLSARSGVRIFEQTRRMIRIGLPEVAESEAGARERMTRYIEDCVKEYLALPERGDMKKREQQAHKYMELRRLLDCYIGREEIPVDVYKIGSTAQTSSYRKWETALKANSGGEKFVVFFALVLSMMNYSRSVTETSGDSSGVLILDNPFGPISSAHLLAPMFDIARRSRIQLICFTHLATADIVGCFDNAYNLKLKARPLSSVETLEAENRQQLECAFYRAEQMRLE